MPSLLLSPDPLIALNKQLSVLNGSIFLLDNYLKVMVSLIRKGYEQNNHDNSNLYAGFALVIHDLSLGPDNNSIDDIFPIGTYHVQGEDYLKTAQLFANQGCAWAIAQAYEAFDTYILDTYAWLIYKGYEQVELKRLEFISADLEGLERNSLAYCRLYVNPSGKKIDRKKCFKAIRNNAKGLKEIEEINGFGFNLIDWFNAISTIRHAVVHSNQIIKQSTLSRLSSGSKQILGTYFGVNKFDTNAPIIIDKKQSALHLGVFGSYAYIIFKKLNQLDGSLEEIFATYLNGSL